MRIFSRHLAAVALLAAGTSVLPAASPASGLDCPSYELGNRTSGVSDSAPGAGPLRVFAIQYRQDVAYAESYQTYADKMECLMQAYVEPNLDPAKVGMVVFNEDIGLATLATGSRGASARAWAQTPVPADTPAIYNQSGAPGGVAAAFGMVAAGYSRQLAAYRARFPDEDPRKAVITAATDTFVRGFMTTFSRMARAWGLYIVASNNQADFHYSTDPADIAAFADPDLAAEYATGAIKGVWVASSDKAWNQAFLFAPHDVQAPGPGASSDPASPEYDPRTNLVYTNRKAPLTDIEQLFLALDEGDMSPANTGPVELPELPGFKFGFAISLPAFQFGYDFGTTPPPGEEWACATPLRWMLCLDRRGVNTVIQPEANPGPWARYGADGGNWQALTWGASTLRAVTDPAVHFKYLVCPHMVGNLVDLPFDGQTAIVERGRTGPGRAYVGAKDFIVGADSTWAAPYSGLKPQFLALAPWVLDDDPSLSPAANRAQLQARAEEMQAGSLSPEQNGYLETAIFADLATP